MVGRYRTRRVKIASAVGRSAINTAVAPTESGNVNPLPRPYAKNNLAAEKTTSLSTMPRIGFAYNSAVQYRFACVWTVPFGLPVEPDEYSQNAMSSQPVAEGLVAGVAASIRSLSRGAVKGSPSSGCETINWQPSCSVVSIACVTFGSNAPDAIT